MLFRSALPFNLIVVDNGSTDKTIAYLKHLEANGHITELLLLGRNMGVSVASNLGWSRSSGDYYLKLDNDVEIVNRHWLNALLAAGEDPDVGMIGYKLCAWHETQPFRLGSGLTIGRFETCGGGCALIPRRTHEKLGYWNEDYGLYGYEDLEYGIRANMLGLVTGYVEDDNAVLHLGANANAELQHETIKKKSIDDAGQKLYLINKFMFEAKLRPICVERRYLSTDNDGLFSFRLNGDLKKMLSLQKYLLRNINVTLTGDVAALDLRKFARQP